VKSGVEQILNRIGNDLGMSSQVAPIFFNKSSFFFFGLVVFVYFAEVDRCYGYRLILALQVWANRPVLQGHR